LVLALGLGLAAFGFATPQMLIVRLAQKDKKIEGDPNNSLIQYIASEFDSDGRVQAIAWGLTDPYFRAAVDGHQIGNPPTSPSLEQALETGKQLKTDYTLVVSVVRVGKDLGATANLYQRGKLVWHDPPPQTRADAAEEKNRKVMEKLAKKRKVAMPDDPAFPKDARIVSATRSLVDPDGDLRSLASTWAVLLETGPLKQFPGRPRIAPTPVDVGQKPVVVDTPPPVHKVDNQDLLQAAMKLLSEKQYVQAITMLRDSVDAEPLDVERRRALVMALAQTGNHAMAASEAKRAAALLPDKVELHVLAAKEFIAAGQSDQAIPELKEAVSRDPDGVETRMLLGEIDLQQLKIADAIGQFDFAISKSANAQWYYERAVAKTLNNDADGATQDLAAAQKAGLGMDAISVKTRYVGTVSMIDQSLTDLGFRLRTLLQRAHVKPGDDAVATETTDLTKKVAAVIGFMDGLAVPPEYKASHDRRQLALKLLSQSLNDIGDYLKAQNDDTISDATINVGEGLKNLDLAKVAYKEELDKG
jgi:tetratricopeptide (TPR) repeat protein